MALLPLPPEGWPQALWLYASIGTAWPQGGDDDLAFDSFDAAYRSEDGRMSPYVLLNLG